MKTKFLATAMLLSIAFFACKKNTETVDMKDQPATSEILTGARPAGQVSVGTTISHQTVYWRINRMIYDDQDMSGNFSACLFEFLPDQTVVVSSKDKLFSVYGKWFMPDRSHLVMYYDASNLPYDIEFEKFLNGEWTILKSSYFGIYLESDENKINRKLGFERIF